MRRPLLLALSLLALGAGLAGPVRGADQPPGREQGALRGRIVTEVEGSQWALAEDAAGRIYSSGNHGVSVFDGKAWARLPLPEAGEIRSLAIDPAGRVWLGSIAELGCFTWQADGTAAFTSIRSHLPATDLNYGQIWSVHAVEDAVFFVADQIVLRWREGRFTRWPLPSVRRLFSTQLGAHVYLHARATSGLWRIGARDAQPTLVSPSSDFGVLTKNTAFIATLPESDGSLLLLSTTAGVFRLTAGNRIEPAGWASHSFFSTAQIEDACRLPDGRIAVATWRAGVVLTDPAGNIVAQINEDRDGLPEHRVNRVLLASNHRLWIATRLGLAEWDIDPAVTYIHRRTGLAGEVSSLARYLGDLYVSTDLGLWKLQVAEHATETARLTPIQVSFPQSTPGTPSKNLSFVTQLEAHGPVLIFADIDGVWRVQDGRFLQVSAALPDLNITKGTTSYARLSAEHLVATCTHGLIGYLHDLGHGWRIFSDFPLPQSRQALAEPGQPHAALVRTALQEIWRATLPDPQPGLTPPGPLQRVLSRTQAREIHHVFAQGPHVHAYTANGTWRLTPGAATFEPTETARPDAWIWAGSAAGASAGWKLSRVALPGNLQGATSLYALYRAHPDPAVGWRAAPEPCLLLSTIGTFRTAFVEPDGVLWLGGTANIVRVETALLPASVRHPPAPPLWRSARTREHPLSLQGIDPLRLPAHSDLAVQWSAPHADRFCPQFFQTRLSGIDPNWSSPTPENALHLERLRPGRYALAVRSTSPLGQVSPAISLAFVVASPWYQTPGAVVLWFGVAGTGVYLIVALRTRQLRQRQRELEAAVQRRTNELLATKDVLQQASSAKTEFISTVSHELRTPLAGARMMADVLLSTSLDPAVRPRVESLHGCLKYLQQMLDETLDLSRIELGHVRYQLSHFRLGQLVHDSVAMFEALATAKGLACRIELGRWENSWYRAESTHLQRVLINYLSNAVKFTPQGAITLTVSAAATAPAGFETLRFTVTDTGAGVAPEVQARIFRAFVRHHDPRRQGDTPGTGLGLALCRMLADLSGGQVGFASTPGVGASFWVEWPLLPATADPEQPHADDRDFSHLRVLVVEDDPHQREATVLLLQELGVIASTAADVNAAERQLRTERFDLVLADYNLGGATGMDLIARCRTLPHFNLASTRFHLITAHSSEAVRQSAHAAGFQGFHCKPISLAALHAVLAATPAR